MGDANLREHKIKRRFVLWGVAGVGVPCGLLTAAILASRVSKDVGFCRAFGVYLLALPIWIGAGFLWGRWMWTFAQRRRAKREGG